MNKSETCNHFYIAQIYIKNNLTLNEMQFITKKKNCDK